jgi:hypothetical protein
MRISNDYINFRLYYYIFFMSVSLPDLIKPRIHANNRESRVKLK